MTGKQRALPFLAPLASTALLLLLELEGCLGRPAGLLYDAALRLRRPAPATSGIVLLDIDDRAIALAGAWPWTTDVLADGLARLEEAGVERVVLDFPLPDAAAGSAEGVPPALGEAFDREFALIGDNVRTLFEGIRRGSVLPRDAPRMVDELVGTVDTARARLLGGLAGARTDPDARLAGALRSLGRAWVAGGLRPDRTVAPVPAALADASRGTGFSGTTADADGVLRRGLPLARAGERVVEGAAFAALLDRLGSPALQAGPRRLVLTGARPPGMPARDIVLAVDDAGAMLLDWPGSAASDGFPHVSWGELVEADWLEQDLVSALREVERAGLLGADGTALLDRWDDAADVRARMLGAGTAGLETEWREARERFLATVDRALPPDGEETAAPLAEVRRLFDAFVRSRAALHDALAGSFCVVSLATRGVPGSLGRTPLGAVASGGSASAALVNTVLAGRPLAALPPWAGRVAGAALALLATLAVLRLRARWTALVGVLVAAAAVAGAGGLLVATGWYVDPVIAGGGPLVACLLLAGTRTLGRSPARRLARQRFAARVARPALRALVRSAGRGPAPAPVREVVVLAARVGGLPVPPAAPVAAALARLHGALGRVVTAHGGTIVRAEADELEACFGAPVPAADDATRACRCALALTAAARQAAEVLVADGLLAAPLPLRVGAAGGPCLVDDLGLPGLAGYAALGPARDAARHLAAACERYGAGVLVAGPTWEAGGRDLVARLLDRLALPIAGAPVRCVELVAEPGGADAATLEAIRLFNEGLARLEAGDRERAGTLFRRVLELMPGDGPSSLYALRCRAPS